MSTSDDNHPESAQAQSAPGTTPPPLSETGTSNALVAARPLLPEVRDELGGGRPSTPEVLHAPPKPLELLQALQRRWLLALILAVVFALPPALYAYFTTPISYRAESWLRVRSTTVLYSVDKGAYSWGAHVQLIRSFFVMNAALSQPGISELPWIQEVERNGGEPADWLAGRIQVNPPSRGGIMMRLAMTGDDPVQLQKLVAAVTDAYLDRVVNAEKKEGLKRRDLLEQTYYKKTDELRKKREDVHALARQLGTASSKEAALQQSMLFEFLLTLRKEVSSYRRQKFFKEYELRQFEEQYQWNDQTGRVPAQLIDDRIAADETLLQLDKAVSVVSEELQQLEGIIRSKNSRRILAKKDAIARLQKEKRNRIAALRADLLEQIRTGKIRTELQKRHDQLTATVEQLGRMEEDFKAEYLKLSQDVKKFSKYSADLDRRRKELNFIQETTNKLGLELEKLQFELSIGGERIELIEKARRPRSRNTKGRDKMTLMAACAGIALALAGTALFEFYHRRVTSGDEMATGLGLRVLGNVPMLSERLWRFRRNGSGKSGEDLQGIMDESVDGIRAMLLHSSDGDVGRVLMVTSAKAGEGKTTVAGALAASLGRSGRRTLLIDGDLRRPSVHRLLDLSLDAGLAEVLRGEASVDDVIRPTRAAGLWCMSAGQCDHVALQALTRDCVGEIFETVRSEFDFVIIDTGPVMSVVDALLLGQHCDGAVLSVVRRVSQLTTVHETCERLKATGIRIVGCVINGLHGNPFTPGYYAYAYGYGYGNGYGNGEPTTEDLEKA